MRVLVTGASGFVGRGLVPYLAEQGFNVRAASRAPDPSWKDSVRIESVGQDTDWSAALNNIDAVVHLAARAHVLKEEAIDPLSEHRRVNTQGTKRLAEQCVAAGIKRFVYMSSIGVLGNNSLRAKNGRAFTESDESNPHDDYSRSKLEAEQELSRIDSLSTTIIRPPLIYGAGVPGNFQRLIGLAKKGRPFPLGGVRNKRSLIGRENLCSFVSLILRDERSIGQTYVIADEELLSTAELYLSLCKHLGSRGKVLSLPEPILRGMLQALGKGKMAERLCDTLVVDSSKARERLGWKQPKSQEDGLEEAVRGAEI